MSTLYVLTGQLLALMDMLEDPDADEQAIKDTIEGIEGEYDDKVEGWCRVIKNLDAEYKALKEESKRLADRARVLDNSITRMKAFVMQSMKATGKTEAGVLLKAKIAKNGGVLPLMMADVNPKDIPQKYQKIDISFNNEEIRKALDAGEQLSFAQYGERGESLRIK